MLPEAAAFDRAGLPVQDAGLVRAALERAPPEVVFNCAAFNGVDAAESEVELAMAVNALGPRVLAAECARVGARLVHFSTNYVFDGSSERPYVEADSPRPLGVYARSKLEGELAVPGDGLVVRTAGVFGHRGSAIKGGSFPERILARARAGEPLRVVDDQHLNPTYARDLAAGALGLAEQGVTGVVHLVAEGCCSWWELASEVLAVAGLSAPVEAISTASLGAAALRPLNGCLGSTRVAPLRHWRDALRDFARES